MNTLSLSSHHKEMLAQSAISDEVAQARGYRTIPDQSELPDLGFAPGQCRAPGLLLPLWTPDGQNSHYTYRPDNPRVNVDKSKRLPDGSHPNKPIKYETPKGASMRLDCNPLGLPHIGDPDVPLYVTEGQKKGDAILSAALKSGLQVCVIALLGVFNWRGKNELGGSTVLADWEYVALNGRTVRIVFDSDVQNNPNVRAALDRLTALLRNKGATVSAVYLPGGTSGKKVGADDWLAAGHTFEELEALAQLPQPAPTPAAPSVELLDEAPLTISRPLSFVGGRSYAATWLHVRWTVTEVLDRKENRVIKLNPPEVETTQQLFVIRDDGRTFGDGADEPLDVLALEVKLSEIPPADKLWSTAGVKRYRAGERPNPADVFGRMVDVVMRYIDFDRSLAPQETMAEFVACYTLSTWFIDSLYVIGFLWPNGERGSGKTHLLHVCAQLSYLGTVILSGGSFASIRDLADYGATLAFDDAEELSDSRKSDPDKRALLLAGNRRGASITTKEPAPDGRSWRTRYVNAFCPRLFSAIRLPDAVLASRTIIVPLVRTANREKANGDPLDFGSWPHDRRLLVDDLWALALSRMAEIPAHDARVGQNSQLIGRNLQPWRAILAVASWLSENGVPDLLNRMEELAMSYQSERPDFEVSDWTTLVIRALFQIAVSAVNAVSADGKGAPREFVFKTASIADAMKSIAEEIEADVDTEKITSRAVGRIVSKLRFPRSRTSREKGWRVTLADLAGLANSYGLHLPDVLESALNRKVILSPVPFTFGTNSTNEAQTTPPLFTNGTNGIDITNGTQLDIMGGTI